MRVRTPEPINKFHRVDDNCPNIGDCRALPRSLTNFFPSVVLPSQHWTRSSIYLTSFLLINIAFVRFQFLRDTTWSTLSLLKGCWSSMLIKWKLIWKPIRILNPESGSMLWIWIKDYDKSFTTRKDGMKMYVLWMLPKSEGFESWTRIKWYLSWGLKCDNLLLKWRR